MRSRSKRSHRRLQIRQRLARIGPAFEPIAQRGELLRDHVGIRLQRARRLQRADIGRHARGEPEARDEHGTHHDQQQGTDTGGDELAATLCAREFHARLSPKQLRLFIGGAKRIAMRAGTSVGTPSINERLVAPALHCGDRGAVENAGRAQRIRRGRRVSRLSSPR